MKNYFVIRLVLCLLIIGNACFGQTPVNHVTTASNVVVPGGTRSMVVRSHPNAVNTILPSTNYTMNYNNTANVNIVDFTLAGYTYVRFSNFDTIIFRRVANAWEPTGGNKQQIYAQGPAVVDNLTRNMNFPVAYPQVTNYAFMERVIEEGYINRGSDNVFNNDAGSDQTCNNIERVDFVYKLGMLTTDTAKAGFLIAERGGNDPFKIAAITGIDALGNPTSFGPVLSVPAASYGSTIMNAPTYVLRKDPADTELRAFSLVSSQSIKAVFIKLRDLGINPNVKIFGYALMANDVTATTSAQLLSFTNSTYFPRTTTTVNGGMDMAAAPGIFHTDLVLAGRYLRLSSHAKDGNQVLSWIDNDFNLAKEYHIEKSLDREHYNDIGVIGSTDDSKYSFTDNNFTTTCYYRLKVVLKTGGTYYSSIVFADKTGVAGNMTVFPNPVKDQLSISYGTQVMVDQVALYSSAGKEIGKWEVNPNNRLIQLDMNAVSKGQYFIKLTYKNQVQRSLPVLKL